MTGQERDPVGRDARRLQCVQGGGEGGAGETRSLVGHGPDAACVRGEARAEGGVQREAPVEGVADGSRAQWGGGARRSGGHGGERQADGAQAQHPRLSVQPEPARGAGVALGIEGVEREALRQLGVDRPQGREAGERRQAGGAVAAGRARAPGGVHRAGELQQDPGGGEVQGRGRVQAGGGGLRVDERLRQGGGVDEGVRQGGVAAQAGGRVGQRLQRRLQPVELFAGVEAAAVVAVDDHATRWR